MKTLQKEIVDLVSEIERVKAVDLQVTECRIGDEFHAVPKVFVQLF